MKTAKAEIKAEAKALRRIPGGQMLDMIRLYADDFRDVFAELDPSRRSRIPLAGGLIHIGRGPRDRHLPRR